MSYSTTKKLRKIKDVIMDVLFFPMRCVCTPIYKLHEKYIENKRYSEKQIRKVVQYLIDYWTDDEEEFYIIADDKYNPFDYSNIQTAYQMQSNMSWGWSGENKRIKFKARHIYNYQKDEYLNMFIKILGEPMTFEEKRQDFKNYQINDIKDRLIYKIIK